MSYMEGVTGVMSTLCNFITANLMMSSRDLEDIGVHIFAIIVIA